jgi:hypothetical protein
LYLYKFSLRSIIQVVLVSVVQIMIQDKIDIKAGSIKQMKYGMLV